MGILKSRLTILITAVIVISLLLVGCLSYINQRDIILGDEKEVFQKIELSVNQSIAEYLLRSSSVASSIAYNPEVARLLSSQDRDGLFQLMNPIYIKLKEQGLEQMQFHLSPANSFLRVNAPDKFGDDLSGFRQTVVEANKSLKPVVGIEAGVTGWGFRAVIPIYYNNVHAGSVETGMNFDTQFLEKQLKTKYPGEYYLYALNPDGSGKLLAATNQDDTLALPVGIVQKIVSSGTMSYGYSDNNDKAYVVVPVKDYSGQIKAFIKVVLDRQETLSQLRKNMLITSVLSVGVLLIAVLLILFVMKRQLVRPIQLLLEKMEIVANGDLSIGFDQNKRGDVGRLEGAISNTLYHLRALIGHIQQAATQLASSSEELTASADQSAQAANQVATVIGEVASGAERQLEAVDAAAAVVGQMSANIQQIAANANDVASASAQSAETAQDGSKTVENVIKQMENIKNAVTRSSEVVTKLGEQSKEIGQIVDTISGLASQTNLLALNAAIEAARAGEQGRGFAVVAEEVRKLAEQSQDAAKQIGDLIAIIQQDTDNAVIAMNEGTKEVHIGSQVVVDAGHAFKEIFKSINAVSTQTREISAAIQQMASGSQQIVNSVRDIDAISKETTSEAQTVSAATEEQSAAMEEIAASSQALAKMTEDLMQAVRKFKI
ncbi:MAG TPA: methyl-accepting chemotaxis protein [Methylomusa anaerophila]|uniref:Methyl-accepting chemotaxis protein McpB n=1 Tax=Methylomusa anaerophila TaxID=1930071 RepID=A0A348ANB9_9FIRM|nr:methyl-accepting chemotaxis protein [Methylomusa anaerophila]BBB92567.1 methyl-accepting chemotaxis protein McpB [Methylomusa anaerophila]HML87577.1 methyl-accepting chemotaxis protein [Methylomusa anaerophila]